MNPYEDLPRNQPRTPHGPHSVGQGTPRAIENYHEEGLCAGCGELMQMGDEAWDAPNGEVYCSKNCTYEATSGGSSIGGKTGWNRREAPTVRSTVDFDDEEYIPRMYESKMPKLTQTEEKIVLAVRNILNESLISEDTTLQDMLKKVDHGVDETSHHSQFRWEGIDDAFKLKVGDSPHADSITSAFFQTHSYKYLDNPTFKLSFERELRQRAVPQSEITGAMGHLESMVSDLANNPAEQDAGWNPNMEDLVDLTSNADNRKASPTDPFTGGGHYPENDTYDKGSLEGF
jgi:hypothetical protein